MPVDIGTIGCAERCRFPRFPSKSGKRRGDTRLANSTALCPRVSEMPAQNATSSAARSSLLLIVAIAVLAPLVAD